MHFCSYKSHAATGFSSLHAIQTLMTNESISRRLHLRRCFGVVILFFGLAAWTLGCSIFGPSDSRVYILSRVNGHPLPASFLTIRLLGGGTAGGQWDRGTLTLGPGIGFRRELVGQPTKNGLALDTVSRKQHQAPLYETIQLSF